jgi:hypothetical protein
VHESTGQATIFSEIPAAQNGYFSEEIVSKKGESAPQVFTDF